MQKRLDPETGVNKIFKNVFMSGAYSEIFSGRKHQFSSLCERSFFRQIYFKQLGLSNKNDSRGIRSHALPQNF